MAEGTITKEVLRQRIETGDADFRAYLSTLSAEQMTAPALDDGWSVKDVVAHIAAWQERLLACLSIYKRVEAAERPAPDITWEEVDGFNQQIYETRSAWTLHEAMSNYRSTLDRVKTALDKLSDDDLNDTPEGPDSGHIWQWIAWNTYGHIAEHIGWMDEAFGNETAAG